MLHIIAYWYEVKYTVDNFPLPPKMRRVNFLAYDISFKIQSLNYGMRYND